MKTPTPQRLWRYVTGRLRLRWYFDSPGDGRPRPQIRAQALLWAMLFSHILREHSFHAVEALVRSPARRSLGISTSFGDDALGYFTERLDPNVTRAALVAILRLAKRNKAFDNCRWIGLAVDGTCAGQRRQRGCSLCRPVRNAAQQTVGYRHHLTLISVVGTGLPLPFDVEPYGPSDSEYAAAQRLLRRAVGHLGKRFAQYVVVDGGLATAPFLHTVGDLGLHVVARLKENLPELFAAAKQRFRSQPPGLVFQEGKDRVEIWEADDFDPWETLRWTTVRVFFYRQHKSNGKVIEAYWLTDFPSSQVGAPSLYRMAKSRWEIENEGFNEAKSRHGLEHVCHHHPISLLIDWLLSLLAISIERLYRLRYLHRGTHPIRTAIELLRSLRLNLLRPCVLDTS